MKIIFGSVCSGIEAASVAWHRFGWRAAWLAEIEKSPALVLHHHYGSGRPHYMPDPDEQGIDQEEIDSRRAAIKALRHLPLVPTNSTTAPPNLGDMTRIEALVRSGQVALPDVLCGGTPCQAFSLAGLRASMEDARGQLTLSFVRLADAIDSARHVRGEPPAVIVWENVFGVLSTKDNAFGAFLGALAGEDSPLQPPGAGWSNAGCVFGPRRTVTWRVYDAQYFGVAQRRRRVFVVASARKDIDTPKILFEFEGVRRDFAPSRSAQENAAGTVRASAGRRGGIQDECGLGLQAVTSTLDASYGRLQGCSGQDANHGHSQLVVASVGNNQAGPIEVATACRAHASPHLDFESETFLVQPAPIAFSCKDYGNDASTDIAPTMRAMNHGSSHANGGGQLAVCVTSEITHTLKGEGFDASEDGTGRGQPIVAHAIQAGALRTNPNSGPDGLGVQANIAYTLEARAEVQCTQIGMAVRRLTPRECERLQDFPDDYTLIPISIISKARAEKLLADGEPARQDESGNWWKMSADGPRYKALGNSWAVANVVWIGRRIDQALLAAMVSA